jgi:hypothetical protein
LGLNRFRYHWREKICFLRILREHLEHNFLDGIVISGSGVNPTITASVIRDNWSNGIRVVVGATATITNNTFRTTGMVFLSTAVP